MCIYYGTREELSYNSREHIFPATIGGIEMLPVGYVSDKANSYFSTLESRMITQSFIGFSKMFFGPGKRGKEKPGRMPITLLKSENEESLGFVYKGKPHHIPQIILSRDAKQLNFIRDLELQTNADVEKLICKLTNFDNKYTLISNKPNLSSFLVGLYENRLYISINDKDEVEKFIEYINKHIPTNLDYSNAQKSKREGPEVALKMAADLHNDARVFAKVAFNILAYVKGPEYLENVKFDEIKHWLLGVNNDKFAQLPQYNKFIKFLIPDDSNMHYCIIINIDNFFVAIVSFYNHWTMCFEICERFDDFFDLPYVYFCDWENEKEYTLPKYLA